MAKANNISDLIVEDATILFRNFEGRESKYNKKGNRNFCLIIDPVDKDHMKAEGWNVKTLTAREEGDEDRYYIQVNCSYDHVAPKIYLVDGTNKTLLDEESVSVLDNCDLASVDLVIHPYQWHTNGLSGIKGYLKSGYFNLVADPFADKYNFSKEKDEKSVTDDDEELPF